MAMDAILATVANCGWGIVDTNREASTNKLISHLIYNLILNCSMAALANHFRRDSRGWGILCHKTHAAGAANGFIMVGMFVRCVFC